MAQVPSRVRVVEVGPRDGLQNEAAAIATRDKVAFIDLLTLAGLPVIEVSAFVNPRRVPQMADAAEVYAGITRAAAVRYPALVPNRRGLERARDAGLHEVAIFGAASETFSVKNINQGIDDSFRTFEDVCAQARRDGIRVRAYLSTSFGCPFEGDVPAERVAALTRRFLDLGVFEVAVSDTIGVAHPGQVRRVIDALLGFADCSALAMHFHDTRGMALANVLTSLHAGIATFDASAGGLGGCPYAPGATGNLATEDLIYMLHGMDIETGVDLAALTRASRFIEPVVGHALPSRYVRAIAARDASPDREEPRREEPGRDDGSGGNDSSRGNDDSDGNDGSDKDDGSDRGAR